jgi:Chaperone of endosialidase
MRYVCLLALCLSGCASQVYSPSNAQIDATRARFESVCRARGIRADTIQMTDCVAQEARKAADASRGGVDPALLATGAGAASMLVPLLMMSDVRAKRDTAAIARLDNGLTLYRFRYLWSDQEYVGVMAQEVQRVIPDAVSVGQDGYLRVNYQRAHAPFMTREEWERRAAPE